MAINWLNQLAKNSFTHSLSTGWLDCYGSEHTEKMEILIVNTISQKLHQDLSRVHLSGSLQCVILSWVLPGFDSKHVPFIPDK